MVQNTTKAGTFAPLAALNEVRNVLGRRSVGLATNLLAARGNPHVSANLAQLTADLVTEVGAAILTKSWHDDISAARATFENDKIANTPEFLAGYPDATRRAVTRIDSKIEDLLKSAHSKTEVQGAELLRWYRERAVLGCPQKAKPLALDRENLERALKEADKLSEEYPEWNRETVQALIVDIVTNSTAPDPSRIQHLLLGPGGTGKSRLVKIVGRALGMNVCSINFPRKEVEKGIGWPWSVVDYPDIAASQRREDLVGRMQMGFLNEGHTNVIFHLEEQDLTDENVSVLKRLLDPEERKMKIGGLGDLDVDIPFDRATIFLSTNHEIVDKAFLSRFGKVSIFAAITDQVRRDLASKGIEKAVERFRYLAPDNPPFDADQLAQLKAVCDQHLETLLELDKKNFPGGRYVQSAASTLVMMIAVRMIRQQPVVARDIEDALETQYAQTQGRPFEGGPVWSGQNDYLQLLEKAIQEREASRATSKKMNLQVLGKAAPGHGFVNSSNIDERIAAQEKLLVAAKPKNVTPKEDQDRMKLRNSRLAYYRSAT
ncbi:AAA family ATPase [Burkholderia vietnamiensis]|nr:AAA family ATPase [Burkholderia vietnamiensis]